MTVELDKRGGVVPGNPEMAPWAPGAQIDGRGGNVMGMRTPTAAELYRAIIDARAELARGNTDKVDDMLTDLLDYPWSEMTEEERKVENQYVHDKHGDVW